MEDKNGQMGKYLKGENGQISMQRYNQFKIGQNQNQYLPSVLKSPKNI